MEVADSKGAIFGVDPTPGVLCKSSYLLDCKGIEDFGSDKEFVIDWEYETWAEIRRSIVDN